jgi:hypothetical protein
MILSLIFSEIFKMRCLLATEYSFLSALQKENCEIPKLAFTDKGDAFPAQLPSLLHWSKLFPTLLSFLFLDPDFLFLS